MLNIAHPMITKANLSYVHTMVLISSTLYPKETSAHFSYVIRFGKMKYMHIQCFLI